MTTRQRLHAINGILLWYPPETQRARSDFRARVAAQHAQAAWERMFERYLDSSPLFAIVRAIPLGSRQGRTRRKP